MRKVTVRSRLFNQVDSLLNNELGSTMIAFEADSTE